MKGDLTSLIGNYRCPFRLLLGIPLNHTEPLPIQREESTILTFIHLYIMTVCYDFHRHDLMV